MTIQVIPDQQRVVTYQASGGETQFPVPWPFFAATDVQVLRTVGTTTTTLTQPADYTVQGAGSQAGGQVTLTTAAAAGERYTLVNVQPFSRTSAYQDGQALQAASLNSDANRLWVALQQLRDQLQRAVRAPVTDPPVTAALPPAGVRANRVLGFDSAGQPVAVVPNPGNLVISTFGTDLIAAADAAAARGLLEAPSQANVNALQAAAVLRDGSQAMTGRLDLAAGAAGGLAFAGDTDTGLVQTADDVVELRTGGDARLTLTNNGIEAHAQLTVPAATAAGHAPRWEQARLSSSGLVSLSGTATDITNIPDNVREVSIWLRNASLSVDTAHFLFQAGSGTTPMTTGYTSVGHMVISSGEVVSSTSGIILLRGGAVRFYTCQVILQRIGSSDDWVGAISGGAVQTSPLSGNLSHCGGFTYFTLSQINMIRVTSSTGAPTLSGHAMVSWRF